MAWFYRGTKPSPSPSQFLLGVLQVGPEEILGGDPISRIECEVPDLRKIEKCADKYFGNGKGEVLVAGEKWIDEYGGLVFDLAKTIYSQLDSERKQVVDVEDLKEEGFIALYEAWRRFNPKRGIKFVTYAYKRVMGAMWDSVFKLSPLTRRERTKLRDMSRAEKELHVSLGRHPTSEELAEFLHVTNEEVLRRRALRTQVSSMESLDVIREKVEGRFFPEPPSSDPTPEEEVMLKLGEEEKERLFKDLEDGVETVLTSEERAIFFLRELQRFTLEELGEFFRISKDTVKRRNQSAQQKLKDFLQSRGWEMEDASGFLS